MNKEMFKSIPLFSKSDAYKNQEYKPIKKVKSKKEVEFLSNIKNLFQKIGIKNGMTLSFHHHLRNGDYVMNAILNEVKRDNLQDISIASTGIFPNYFELAELIEKGHIRDVYTNYLNGPASSLISKGKLTGHLIMDTHGGRARAIETGELPIDIAFLASPAVDRLGNGCGCVGYSACGSLGYAMSDLEYAKHVVLVTDTIVDNLPSVDFPCEFVDYVLKLNKIGDPAGIVSGTTKITKDPIGLKIAHDTALLLDELGIIKDGFSMQTGAGGTSLAVTSYIMKLMEERNIKGSFASGGITSYYVQMLEKGLFANLYDVQCFDLEAVQSLKVNKNHLKMSASEYGNPFYPNGIASKLDFVILGATEIDLNFNVNVTTDSYGNIIGGSGGHSDTAHGAKVTIITTNLLKSRLPIIKDDIMTITTPGEDIDIVVTERGIAVNPKRTDLLNALKMSKLKIMTIEELKAISDRIAGIPKKIKRSDKIIGYVRYRDGSLIDYLYQKAGE